MQKLLFNKSIIIKWFNSFLQQMKILNSRRVKAKQNLLKLNQIKMILSGRFNLTYLLLFLYIILQHFNSFF